MAQNVYSLGRDAREFAARAIPQDLTLPWPDHLDEPDEEVKASLPYVRKRLLAAGRSNVFSLDAKGRAALSWLLYAILSAMSLPPAIEQSYRRVLTQLEAAEATPTAPRRRWRGESVVGGQLSRIFRPRG